MMKKESATNVSPPDLSNVFSKPLDEIRLDPRLKRQLKEAGFSTLSEALKAPEGMIDRFLSNKASDSWNRLLDRLEDNPLNAAKELTERLDQERLSAIRRSMAVLRDDAITDNPRHAPIAPIGQNIREEKTANPLPNNETTSTLSELERLANKSLAILADRSESALIAECFPSLILQLDDIEREIICLFRLYHKTPSKALAYARLYFPNCFLVFIANAASKDFDGDSFWKELFIKIGIVSQSVQISFKRAFCQGVKDKGLPYFTAEDNDFHFLYTALLHGGFSESFWRPMWSDVILPHSKNTSSSWNARKSGSELLRSMKNGACSLNLQREYAKKIVEKAPSSMLEPLLDSALAVAADLVDSEESRSGPYESFEMLSTHGLPDAAMQALRYILESRKNNSSKRFIYLPTAEMRLDPANGRVHLHWDIQKLPPRFAGYLIKYRVNGRLEHTETFSMSVGKCLLPELDLSLSPNGRFDIELSLYGPGENEAPLTTLSQTFDRTRPGSFEFVKRSDGVFRLRKKHERITKTKHIAYLTKAGLKVVPGYGMRPLEHYEAEQNWNGASIQLFEVNPGSSGSITNILTGDKIACWQENYRVEIDRSHVIGKTSDKRDLYGFSYSQIETNDNLPEIFIESHNAATIRNDLDIRCECDGKRISLPWKVYQDIVDHEPTASGKLVIKPAESGLIDRFVSRGQISVFHKPSGTPVLNYKFSIIPIRCFGIEEMFWDLDKPQATYTFEAIDKVTVPSEDGDYEMLKHDHYYFSAPLEAEHAFMTIRNDRNGATLDINLNLAGIKLSVPNDLIEMSAKRPICSADMGIVDGRICLKSTERRQTRAVYISLGPIPLLLRRLRGSTTHSLNVFKDPTQLKSSRLEERRDVVMVVSYGDRFVKGKIVQASASLRLARCTTGFGLGAISLRRNSYGLCMCFENCAPTDLEIIFLDKRGKKELGIVEVAKDQSFAAIPKDAVYQLDIKRAIIAKVSSLDLFGMSDENTSMTYELMR